MPEPASATNVANHDDVEVLDGECNAAGSSGLVKSGKRRRHAQLAPWGEQAASSWQPLLQQASIVVSASSDDCVITCSRNDPAHSVTQDDKPCEVVAIVAAVPTPPNACHGLDRSEVEDLLELQASGERVAWPAGTNHLLAQRWLTTVASTRQSPAVTSPQA